MNKLISKELIDVLVQKPMKKGIIPSSCGDCNPVPFGSSSGSNFANSLHFREAKSSTERFLDLQTCD